MSSQRITVRVSRELGARLQERSRAKGKTPSDLIRVAIEDYLEREPGAQSVYELAREAGLIGCVKDGPKDLATNPRYFKGFGRAK
jgi:predicted DNA-binding protein